MNSNDVVGTIGALWRFPVKSMQGEQLDAADVGEAGVVGDIAMPDPRCVMTTVAQPDLPRDPSILKSFAKQQVGRGGRGAISVRGGLRRDGVAREDPQGRSRPST